MWQRKELRTLSSVLSGRVRSQGDQKPAITIHPKSDRWEDRVAARDYTNSQLEVWDFISGRLRPELGGKPEHLDIVGVNYYAHNQWIDGGTWIEVDHPLYCPLHGILRNIYARYRRPMFIAETGIEAHERPLWLRFLANEVAQARALGVPLEAARMAVEDAGGKVLNVPIELVNADHQNKPDVGPASRASGTTSTRSTPSWS
jgi:hypothetical protein